MSRETAAAVPVVTGRRVTMVPADDFRRRVASYSMVVVDLGAGDGLHALALARSRPDRFVIAVDADAAAMREASHRASRRAARGGVPNVAFVRAGVERLPGPLAGLADEILVLYPWGSLLRGLLRPEPAVLAGVAGLARPGASLRLVVNSSALQDARVRERWALPPVDGRHVDGVLRPAYAAAGWELVSWRPATAAPETPWARRLGQGKPLPVLEILARRRGRGA